MRVQGGTSGILSAFNSGRLDPFDADFEPHVDRPRHGGSDYRQRIRRDRRRAKKAERFARLADAPPF